MKKVLVLFSLILFVSFGMKSYAQTAKTQEVKIKTFFDCANGKATIEKELLKMPGVTKVDADLNSKMVTISFDPNQMSKVRLNSVIERAGYKTELTKEGTIIKSACEKKEVKSEEK